MPWFLVVAETKAYAVPVAGYASLEAAELCAAEVDQDRVDNIAEGKFGAEPSPLLAVHIAQLNGLDKKLIVATRPVAA